MTEQLIRQCQQGDRASMGQLYTAMHDELLAKCRKYTTDEDTANDLLHDAFLLIFSNIDKLRSPEKGRQWMHKVVRNVCLLYAQHRQSRTTVSIDEVRETANITEPSATISYEEILSAVEQLPNGYRQVFRLSVIEGLTHQQIAELLNIEPHTSSSQLLRAKRQLRHLLLALMLLLLIALPLGIYYHWPTQEKKHDVAQSSDIKPTVANPAITDSTGSTDKRILTESLRSVEPQQATQSIVMPTENAKVTDKNGTDSVSNTNVNNPLPSPLSSQPSPIASHPSSLSAHHSPLTLSLAYSGLPNSAARQLPYGEEGMNGDIDSVTHHHMPITIGLNARYHIGAQWWLESGLRYTLLSSETRVGNTYLMMEQKRRVQYLGLSLGAGRYLWQNRHWSLYATGAVIYELPIHSTENTSYWKGAHLIDKEHKQLSPHSQWSVAAGVGLQYNLTPAIGFFMEPSLQYHFHNGDGISTWRKEHPFTPMLPLGIRITF